MERKLLGLLLTVLGIGALFLADIYLLRTISLSAYGDSLYTTYGGNSSGLAAIGFGAAGLLFIFLGIKMIRNTTPS